MVNPAAEVNARFSPLVVRVELYVRAYMCVGQPHIFVCMSEEGSTERARERERLVEVRGEQ